MNYISHLMDDDTMTELVRTTGLGIESIDFSISENLDCFDRTMEVYRQRLEKMGNPPLTLHGPFLDLNPMAFDSQIQQVTMNRYEQAYEAARRLGARKLILHSGFLPSVYFMEGWAERMVDFYNHFLENKNEEIQIAMENVLDPQPEPLAEVAEKVEHPSFGICLDVGHAHCYSKIELEQWIKVLEPYISHLHLHDNCGERDSHLAVGDGNIDWNAVKKLLSTGTEYTLECRVEEDVRKSAGRLSDWQNFGLDIK